VAEFAAFVRGGLMSSAVKGKGGSAGGGFVSELFRFGLYKPNQGRVVRQVTFLAIALIACLAGVEIFNGWGSRLGAGGLGIAFLVAGLGAWVAYRLVNYSVFADFLIAVEAEMNKVSWPGRQQLWNASVVVMFVIFAMAAALFLFDVIWTRVFEIIGIRYSGG